MIEIPGYRLVRKIGRGGMATVWLAVQQSMDREVALKIMSPVLLADPDFGRRFLREARIAARIQHRHVVSVYDVGQADDHHYIAMEYLSGGSVLGREGHARDLGFALRVVREIAGALAQAHLQGFVHRDVKPDNLLLRADGSSALTDFGVAHVINDTLRVTRTGAMIGTPHYMSPEQARGGSTDGRSDLYALGIVLHELVTGRVPYHATDPLAVGIMHLSDPLPTLSARFALLQPLLDRLLAKQPADRFQSGLELVDAIAELEVRLRNDARDDLALTTELPLPLPYRQESAPTVVRSERSRPQGRREPDLGRMSEVVAALGDEPPRRGVRGKVAAPSRRPRRRVRFGLVGILLALLALGAWQNQDRLGQLLPRTQFNDTLARAQRALDAGYLDGTHGDSARELFLAAGAQNPDNDVARRGLQQVGERLLERAQVALEQADVASARSTLERARALLGGGPAVDAAERELRRLEASRDAADARFAAANAALSEGRLQGADGAAALFQRILEIEPDNALARSGLGKVAEALATRVGQALAADDAATATALADEIARILPTYPRLPELFGRIARLRDGARVKQDARLTQAETALRGRRLSGSPDSALELFREVLERDPTNQRARDGIADIARARLAQAQAAIDAGNAASAERLIAAATEIAPDAPELHALRVNLRELRERAAIEAERPALSAVERAEVRRLVGAADEAAAAGNLILPPGASAWDRYRAALAIDGSDRAALDGLAALPRRARELFAKALADGAPQRARGLLDSITQIDPGSADLQGMRARLAESFLDQCDARLGEGRGKDAAAALAAARELNPGNPRIEPLAQRLRQLGAGVDG